MMEELIYQKYNQNMGIYRIPDIPYIVYTSEKHARCCILFIQGHIPTMKSQN